VYSRNSDYSEPETDSHTFQMLLTPDETIHFARDAPTGGIDLVANAAMTTITALLIENKDATNYVDIGYTDSGANANTVYIGPGNIALIPDIDASSAAVTATANTATVELEVWLCGT
jgi:hypothetical protein